MESRKSIEDFLREVDEDLLIYAGELRSNGFTSTASAKYLTENDLAGIPEGHKRLILNMVSRLRTPVRERPQTKFPSFSEKSPASKSPARKKTVLSAGEASVGQEAQWSQREASVSRPTIRRKLLSPGERFIEEKRRAVEEKLAEAAEKRKVLEDCYRRIKEAASENNLTGQRCSNCHYRNHTVRSCQMEKCESVFFCGEITRHPDEKMKLQEQKNKIKALETSATKLEQELRSREAAFDRVQGSVNKQLEDMLLKEYPEEYVQNNARNWLKIQQDIAFVKKSLKGSGPPRREIVKSLLERKKSAENDKRLGLKSLPERGAAANSSTADCSQTRVRLESYGVTFPDRRDFTSSTSFCLSPNTAEEEEEQLCMAKQLSLGSIPFDNGDNTEQTKEVANILLSFKSSKE